MIEALGVLEHANLLTRRHFGAEGGASTYSATRLGETALADGTAGNELGLGAPEGPPITDTTNRT